MKWNRAYEINFGKGRFFGGLTFFPYQIAFGVSIRFWSCNNALCFRFYVGPIKLWWSYEIIKKGRKIQ